MKRQLFWRLCLVIATGIVALFYLIDHITSRTEQGLSTLKQSDKEQIIAWGREAERLYHLGDEKTLNEYLDKIKLQENTWVAVSRCEITHIAGSDLKPEVFDGYNNGRNVEWNVHLYFDFNPIMEVPFETQGLSFLIQLPQRKRHGAYWQEDELALQVFIPIIL